MSGRGRGWVTPPAAEEEEEVEAALVEEEVEGEFRSRGSDDAGWKDDIGRRRGLFLPPLLSLLLVVVVMLLVVVADGEPAMDKRQRRTEG